MNYSAGGTGRLPLDELTLAVARIRGVLLTEEKVDRAVHLLAQAIKESMPGVSGTGVSLMAAGGRRTSSGFTDALVQQADNAQYRLGEGPCLTAWATEQVVVVDDVSTDRRWLAWRLAVEELPVRSVVSAPLLHGKETIGALKIYSALPGQYDDNTGRILSLFAGTAATLLAHIQGKETPLQMSGGLKAALFGRDTVNRACGMLMERQGISQESAMQQLIQNARMAGIPLVTVSEQLIGKVPPPEGR